MDMLAANFFITMEFYKSNYRKMTIYMAIFL